MGEYYGRHRYDPQNARQRSQGLRPYHSPHAEIGRYEIRQDCRRCRLARSGKDVAFRILSVWLNQDDADVVKYLKYFTFLSKEEIDALAEAVEKEPEKTLGSAPSGGRSYDLRPQSGSLKEARILRKPSTTAASPICRNMNWNRLLARCRPSTFQRGKRRRNWLIDANIYKSKRQAREDITNGAVTINGVKVTSLDEIVKPHKNSNGKFVIVRKGKKKYTLARVQQ